MAWWNFVATRTSKCSATVILESFVLIALFYSENYCSTHVLLCVQMKTTTTIAIVFKKLLFIDAESEQIGIVKSGTFNFGIKIGFLLLLTYEISFHSSAL